MDKKTILTGLRANNRLTIGNYFGAILPIVDMIKHHASDYRINMFIPDLHSFTTEINHRELYDNVFLTAKQYIAAGLISHDNVLIYRQSFISAHSELAWILNCFTGVGELSRMTQYKDKSSSIGAERVSAGLFNYPVLMASDILLYNADYVPVGDDQTQHLEFTRNIGLRFNSKFGKVFTIPKPVSEQHSFFGNDQGLRIKDLVNPNKKMSKSDQSEKGVIFLTDNVDTARKKIFSASTDSLTEINYNPVTQAGVSNLIEIMSLLTNTPLEHIIDRYTGSSKYDTFKEDVADALSQFLTTFQSNLDAIDDGLVESMLNHGETKARTIANQTLNNVQMAVGLRK